MSNENKCYLIEYNYRSTSNYTTTINAVDVKECMIKFITGFEDSNNIELATMALVGCETNNDVIRMINKLTDNRRITEVHIISETIYPQG